MAIDADSHGLDQKDISAYFDGQSNTLLWISLGVTAVLYAVMDVIGVIIGLALVGYVLYKKFGDKGITDEQIDEAWAAIAESRREEAHKVALIDKEDTIRDAEWFFAWPDDLSPDTEYKSKEGEDGYFRRNHQRLVYMIYGKDQLVTFGETICIEDNWDGDDDSKEYYWQDVSSMGFDQKTNVLELACGPKIINYPLAGQDEDGFTDEKVKTEKATSVANSVRVILRERKSN